MSPAPIPDWLIEALNTPNPDKPVKEPKRQRAIIPVSGGGESELNSYLECIDPDCSYQDWFETIAASINVFGRFEEVIETSSFHRGNSWI